jgi:hypothetical protein
MDPQPLEGRKQTVMVLVVTDVAAEPGFTDLAGTRARHDM